MNIIDSLLNATTEAEVVQLSETEEMQRLILEAATLFSEFYGPFQIREIVLPDTWNTSIIRQWKNGKKVWTVSYCLLSNPNQSSAGRSVCAQAPTYYGAVLAAYLFAVEKHRSLNRVAVAI